MPPATDPTSAFARLHELKIVNADSAAASLYRAGGPDLPLIDLLTIRDLLKAAPDSADSIGPHALLTALFLAVREGSLCLRLTRDAIARHLATFLPPDHAAPHAEQALAAVDSQLLSPLIADGDNSAPLVAERFRPLIRAAGSLFFHRYFISEQSIRTELRSRAATKIPADPAAIAAASQTVLETTSPRLNAEQEQAVSLPLTRAVCVVSGGPGTGKTSIVLAILRCLARLGVDPARMLLAAPTGRAAQRLGAAVRAGLAKLPAPVAPIDAALADVPAATLHRLLGYHAGTGAFDRDRENPLDADVVIVDECSMADATLMARLLQAVPPAARLVLLGDKDQLPSVEAGAVLASLLPDQSPAPDGVVVLSKNYRSQPEIQRVAAAINRGIATIIDELPRVQTIAQAFDRDGVMLAEPDDANSRLRVLLDGWAATSLKADDATAPRRLLDDLHKQDSQSSAARQIAATALRQLDRHRILTVTRQGPLGAEPVNAYLSTRLRQLDPGAPGPLFAGLPVMATSNDYAREIFNGDVGLCVRDRAGNLLVWLNLAAGPACFAPDSIPGLEPAAAVTVHKGQGSEYENVLLILPTDAAHRLLTRQILYTAVTRAIRRVVIFATPEVLRTAISRPMIRDSRSLWSED